MILSDNKIDKKMKKLDMFKEFAKFSERFGTLDKFEKNFLFVWPW